MDRKKLDQLLTTPSEKLAADMKMLDGDIMIFGAGGKMGPTLSILAKNAAREAGVEKHVIAVSRFSDPIVVELLKKNGVEMISADLLTPGALEALPNVENIIFMAGKKFGTDGNEYATWAMNTWLPSRVAERFQRSAYCCFLQRQSLSEGFSWRRRRYRADTHRASWRILYVLPGTGAYV